MVKKIVSNIEKIHQIISETVWLVPHYRHLIRDCYGHQSVLDAHHGEIIIVHRTFWHNWFPSLWALFVGITWGFYFCYNHSSHPDDDDHYTIHAVKDLNIKIVGGKMPLPFKTFGLI